LCHGLARIAAAAAIVKVVEAEISRVSGNLQHAGYSPVLSCSFGG
jgi:hypothetical protein